MEKSESRSKPQLRCDRAEARESRRARGCSTPMVAVAQRPARVTGEIGRLTADNPTSACSGVRGKRGVVLEG